MNRFIGILFILIAIAIGINIYMRLPALFDAFASPDSSIRWVNRLTWEVLKGIVAFVLLRAGVARVKR